MERGAIWISKDLFNELNKERARIKLETGKEPTWDRFIKTLFDAYKKLKEMEVG